MSLTQHQKLTHEKKIVQIHIKRLSIYSLTNLTLLPIFIKNIGKKYQPIFKHPITINMKLTSKS